MKKIQHIFEYTQLSTEELDEKQKKLISYARQMREIAYAPYSKFKVGAAILLENAQMIGGNNQENIAYPSGLCAERVAIYACKSQFPLLKIKAIAIISSDEDKIISPCGGCRQVMSEVIKRQGDDFDVIMASVSNVIITKASDLIPLAFDF